jgi:hypothetical protein
MKPPAEDPEALLAALVQATRATPTAKQAERLEQRLSPWLEPKASAPARWRGAAKVLLAAIAAGLLVYPHMEEGGGVAKREASSPIAAPRATFVRHEVPTAPEKAPVELPPEPIAFAAPRERAPIPSAESAANVVPAKIEEPANADVAELAPTPVEATGSPAATRRESEVDYLRRAQAALASSPSETLKMVDAHPTLYPRGILAQEREVIAIDALARLGRRSEAIQRAAAFRSAFPRSAHLSRLAALTEKP